MYPWPRFAFASSVCAPPDASQKLAGGAICMLSLTYPPGPEQLKVALISQPWSSEQVTSGTV